MEQSHEAALKYLGQAVADKVVEVELRNVYGNNLMYPVNTTARIFAKLLGVKTFNRQQVQGMRDLGYVVGHVVSEVSL
jgi:hypothetical protein